MGVKEQYVNGPNLEVYVDGLGDPETLTIQIKNPSFLDVLFSASNDELTLEIPGGLLLFLQKHVQIDTSLAHASDEELEEAGQAKWQEWGGEGLPPSRRSAPQWRAEVFIDYLRRRREQQRQILQDCEALEKACEWRGKALLDSNEQ